MLLEGRTTRRSGSQGWQIAFQGVEGTPTGAVGGQAELVGTDGGWMPDSFPFRHSFKTTKITRAERLFWRPRVLVGQRW